GGGGTWGGRGGRWCGAGWSLPCPHSHSCIPVYGIIDQLADCRYGAVDKQRRCLMRGLAGKGVLISGGTSGIGLAAAARFLEEGCRVFIAGLDPAELHAAVAGLRRLGQVSGVACDVRHDDDVPPL